MPELLGLYQSGRLKFDELVTRRYRLEEINDAIDDLRDGINISGRDRIFAAFGTKCRLARQPQRRCQSALLTDLTAHRHRRAGGGSGYRTGRPRPELVLSVSVLGQA